MKAIVFTQYGSPDGLEIKEIPKPTPKDDELLIGIHASSINPWDWEFLNGSPFVNRLMFGLLKHRPGKQILVADIAGVRNDRQLCKNCSRQSQSTIQQSA